MKLIDKDTLVAQIKKKIEINLKRNEDSVDKHDDYGTYYWGGVIAGLNVALMLCDTLEVKEVDFEEEIYKWQQKHFEGIGYILDGSGGWIGRTSLLDIAKHFFELGLKAAQT